MNRIGIYSVAFIFSLALFIANAKADIILDYVSPTEANATTIIANHTYVNVSVSNTTEIDAVQFEWNFSGKNTNVTIFDKDSLVGVYRLDNNTRDYSGNGADGTQNRGVNCSADVTGYFGTACQFDGSDDYIEVDGIARTNKITGSMSAWITAGSGTQNGLLHIIADVSIATASTDRIMLGILANNLLIRYRVASTNYDAIVASGNYQTATFINVITVWNESHVSIYLDGGYKNATAKGGNITATLNNAVFGATAQGATGTAQFWHGKIDELRIYNKSLSTDEIGILWRSEIGQGNYTGTGGVFFQNITNMTDGDYKYKSYANMTDGTANSTAQRFLCVTSGTICAVITTYSGNVTLSFSLTASSPLLPLIRVRLPSLALDLAESRTSGQQLGRTFTNAIDLSELPQRIFSAIRLLTNAIDLSEIANRVASFLRLLTNILTLTDSMISTTSEGGTVPTLISIDTSSSQNVTFMKCGGATGTTYWQINTTHCDGDATTPTKLLNESNLEYIALSASDDSWSSVDHLHVFNFSLPSNAVSYNWINFTAEVRNGDGLPAEGHMFSVSLWNYTTSIGVNMTGARIAADTDKMFRVNITGGFSTIIQNNQVYLSINGSMDSGEADRMGMDYVLTEVSYNVAGGANNSANITQSFSLISSSSLSPLSRVRLLTNTIDFTEVIIRLASLTRTFINAADLSELSQRVFSAIRLLTSPMSLIERVASLVTVGGITISRVITQALDIVDNSVLQPLTRVRLLINSIDFTDVTERLQSLTRTFNNIITFTANNIRSKPFNIIIILSMSMTERITSVFTEFVAVVTAGVQFNIFTGFSVNPDKYEAAVIPGTNNTINFTITNYGLSDICVNITSPDNMIFQSVDNICIKRFSSNTTTIYASLPTILPSHLQQITGKFIFSSGNIKKEVPVSIYSVFLKQEGEICYENSDCLSNNCLDNVCEGSPLFVVLEGNNIREFFEDYYIFIGVGVATLVISFIILYKRRSERVEEIIENNV